MSSPPIASLDPNLPIVHVSFGTAAFSQSLIDLERSAHRFGVRDVRLHRPMSPVIQRAYEENPVIMRAARGAGYWLWKPYVILDALART